MELRRGDQVRNLPLENFFLDYGKQDRQPGEFVRRLLVPKLRAGSTHFRAYKITKRFDEDISAVLAAFCLKVDDGRISEARVAFGGMAGIPKRAKAVEEKLRGLSLATRTVGNAAAEAVSKDFTPLTDLRASAGYRSRVAGNLVVKAMAEIAGVSPRHHAYCRITGWSPMPPNDAVLEAPLRHVYKPLPHDSGAKHVQGAAEYIDDMPEPVGTLHVAVGGSPVARGTHPADRSCRGAERRLASLPSSRRRDIPGKNDISPGHADEPVFAQDRVDFHGQPVFAVDRHVARCRAGARRCSARSKSMPKRRTCPSSRARRPASACLPDYAFVNGDAAKAIAAAPLSQPPAAFQIGGQEHFYLEGQVALAVPGEDGAVLVYSSTQHPSEVQHIVARVLALPGLVRDLPRAPHGRRLRRQGNASDAVGGDCRAWRRARPAGPASSGSTATPTWS